MKPYFKLVFGTDTGGTVNVNVSNAKTFSEEMLGIAISTSMNDILLGNVIKTKDDSNLAFAKEAFYCTTESQSFDVAE